MPAHSLDLGDCVSPGLVIYKYRVGKTITSHICIIWKKMVQMHADVPMGETEDGERCKEGIGEREKSGMGREQL